MREGSSHGNRGGPRNEQVTRQKASHSPALTSSGLASIEALSYSEL